MTPNVMLSLRGIAPELILVIGAVLLLMWDLFFRRTERFCLRWGIVAALAALYVIVVVSPVPGGSAFSGQLSLDGITLAARVLTLGMLILTLLISRPYLAAHSAPPAEYTCLLLFASAGLIGVAASKNWIVLFIFLETVAVSMATLLGSQRKVPAAREASLKYFILSAFASGFLLYGIALMFYATGTFAIGLPLRWGPVEQLALFLVLAGLAFKCALVPFHMWAPDVYQGGPTPVVAFLASASKAIGFLVLARVFLEGGAVTATFVKPALWVVAALSMVVGTVLALAQTNVKRMLAYSGIAHAGYILIAYVAAGPGALGAVLSYIMVYALMTFGAFTVLAVVESAGVPPDVKGLTGLGRRAPGLALALAVFMVSLTGLPPTAGFIAKFVVFQEVLQAGHLWLVLIAVAMSVVSVGFYLRLLVPVFMSGSEGELERLRPAPEGAMVAIFLAVALLVIGILPQTLLAFGSLLAAP